VKEIALNVTIVMRKPDNMPNLLAAKKLQDLLKNVLYDASEIMSVNVHGRQDRKEILRLHNEDPQKLINNLVILEFREIQGAAIMVDGVAAGTEFDGIKFLTGPYAKKTLYCEYLEDGKWLYETDVNSDGFLFNVKNPNEENCGGDHIPELNGKTLTLK